MMRIVRKQQRKIEVDLFAVIQLFWKKKWTIMISGLLAALLFLAVTILFIRPRYSASVTLYANNSNSSDINTNITSQDINTSVQLVDRYAAIILSDAVLDQVIENNGLGITGQELSECIEIASVNNTEVFKITVEYSTPEDAASIANSIADIAPFKIADIVEGSSVKIVSRAKVPTDKSFPSIKMALLWGMVIGVILSILTILITALLDTHIKSKADLHEWDYPVLGAISTKDVPFAVEEAYKSLGTNLVFSLPEDECKIIEITSSTQKEGKSTTAIGLAIALAQNGARVILIDCDLRSPAIAEKLKIRQKPGLTNLLYGLNSGQDIVYHHPCGIDVIPAGELPPDPSATLGSSRMTTVLAFMKNHYDYVILDAPSVGVVADAAVLASRVSGVILAVRQGLASYEGVDAAISKLVSANGNLLGFVLTDATKKDY